MVRFSIIGMIDILGLVVVCGAVCPVHCRMFTASLTLLSPPGVTVRKVSGYYLISLGGKIIHNLRFIISKYFCNIDIIASK